MVHETNPTPNGVEHGRVPYFMQIRKVFEDVADLGQRITEIQLNLRGF